jgi:hypothetical protein
MVLNPLASSSKNNLDDFCLDFIYSLRWELTDSSQVKPRPSMNPNKPSTVTANEKKGRGDSVRRMSFVEMMEGHVPSQQHVASSLSALHTEESGKKISKLFRRVSCQSEPIVINISQQEGKILVRWLEYVIRNIPIALNSLNINVSRIQNTARGVVRKIEKREYLAFVERLFREKGLDQHETIPPVMLNDIFELFLEPLQLLVSELEEQKRDLLAHFDINLDGRISQNEFERGGLDLYSRSWRIRDYIPLKVLLHITCTTLF